MSEPMTFRECNSFENHAMNIKNQDIRMDKHHIFIKLNPTQVRGGAELAPPLDF